MNPNDALKTAKDALDRAVETQRQNKAFLSAIGPAIVETMQPFLKGLKEEIGNAFSKIRVEVNPHVEVTHRVDAPPVHLNPTFTVPDIHVPAPEVTVNVPEIKIPEIKFPEEMPVSGFLGIMGYDSSLLRNPIPVQIRDMKGNPVSLNGGGSVIQEGGGGFQYPVVSDIQKSSNSIISDAESALRITGTVNALVTGANNSSQLIDSSALPYSAANPLPVTFTGAAGTNVSLVNADGAYYSSDNPVPVTFSAASVQPVSQVSGAAWSTYLTGAEASTFQEIMNPDGRVKVELPTGSSGLTDTELRASSVPVAQASGANWSTAVTNTVTVDGSGVTQPISATDLDIRDLANGSDSVSAYQVSGAVYSVNVVNPVNQGDAATALRVVVAGNSDASVVVNSGTLTGITNTIGVNQVSGANWSVVVTGSTGTTAIVGDIASDVADTESNPVKIGGIARTANPAAVAGGDRVAATFDDIGRQVFRPLQVRDLTLTAYVSVANGTETTLLAASAGSFHDCIMLTATNNSSFATQLDVRAVTGGNIIHTMYLPAEATVGWAPALPWPQDATGNNWTIDLPDVTGTTVYVSGLFVREV